MASNLNDKLGYLSIDNRNNPGVDDELVQQFLKAKPGEDVLVGPRPDAHLEADTYTCPHCNRIVIKHVFRARERTVCRKCMKVVCDICAVKVPFECIPLAAIFDSLEYEQIHGRKKGG